jgi:hypothetical protein
MKTPLLRYLLSFDTHLSFRKLFVVVLVPPGRLLIVHLEASRCAFSFLSLSTHTLLLTIIVQFDLYLLVRLRMLLVDLRDVLALTMTCRSIQKQLCPFISFTALFAHLLLHSFRILYCTLFFHLLLRTHSYLIFYCTFC